MKSGWWIGASMFGAMVAVVACKRHGGVEGTTGVPSDAGSDPAWADVVVPPIPDLTKPTDGGCGRAAAADAGRCSGSSCGCAMESCAFACGPEVVGASLGCTEAASCQAACGDGCNVACSQSTACGARLGDHATLGCGQSEACAGRLGKGGTVNCYQGVCTVTVGADSTVDCREAEACAVTCEGACDVDCRQGNCRVHCPPGATCPLQCAYGALAVTCPDGTLVCDAKACPK